MAVTSTSTPDEILAEYADTADYDIVGSVSKAKRFVHAARLLLVQRPASTSVDGVSQTFNPSDVREQLAAATRYLAAHDTSRRPNGNSRAWNMRGLRS